jgi:MOSC domain-containing protein YiiM
MQVISVNVGLPRIVEWQGEAVETAIFKEPVHGPVAVHRLNLAGDRQADLTVHGGADKAVYAYPSEHYDLWRQELPKVDFPWGAFGENFTTAGLTEADVHVGDRLRIGTAELTVTQPRTPCFKLGLRFRRPDMLKRLLQSGRTGFYLAVAREGHAAEGDDIVVIARDPRAVSISDIVSLYASGRHDQALLRRASELPALPAGWREYFANRLR